MRLSSVSLAQFREDLAFNLSGDVTAKFEDLGFGDSVQLDMSPASEQRCVTLMGREYHTKGPTAHVTPCKVKVGLTTGFINLVA